MNKFNLVFSLIFCVIVSNVIAMENVERRLSRSLEADSVQTPQIKAKLVEDFAKLSKEEKKELESKFKKFTQKVISNLTVSDDFRNSIKAIGSAAFVGALVGLTIFLGKLATENYPLDQILSGIQEEVIAAGIIGAFDALAKLQVGAQISEGLYVSPVASGAIAGTRELIALPTQSIAKIGGSAGKAAVVNIVMQVLASYGGPLKILKDIGGLELFRTPGRTQSIVQKLIESSNNYVSKRSDLGKIPPNQVSLINKIYDRAAKSRIVQLLNKKDIVQLTGAIATSAVIGTVIYLILQAMGLMVPGVSLPAVALMGGYQGLINYIGYSKANVGNLLTNITTTSAVLPIITAGMTRITPAGIIPLTGYIMAKSIVDEVIDAKGGLKGFVQSVPESIQVLPKSQGFFNWAQEKFTKFGQVLAEGARALAQHGA